MQCLHQVYVSASLGHKTILFRQHESPRSPCLFFNTFTVFSWPESRLSDMVYRFTAIPAIFVEHQGTFDTHVGVRRSFVWVLRVARFLSPRGPLIVKLEPIPSYVKHNSGGGCHRYAACLHSRSDVGLIRSNVVEDLPLSIVCHCLFRMSLLWPPWSHSNAQQHSRSHFKGTPHFERLQTLVTQSRLST